MSSSGHDNERRRLAVEELGRAAAIRALADDEISLDQAAARGVDVSEGSDDQRSASFERSLRASVGRAMSESAAPAALAGRISAAIAAERAREDELVGEALDERADETRRPAFWQRHSRAIGALAAVMVLGFVGVFLSTVPFGHETELEYRNRLTSFVANEHSRVSRSEAAIERKFSLKTAEAAHDDLLGVFGKNVAIPDCVNNGLTFVGCGDCHVPGTRNSAHMQFVVQRAGEGADAASGARYSLFVGDDEGALRLDPTTVYQIDTASCGVPEARVYVWTADQLMYCLVTKDASGAAAGSSIGATASTENVVGDATCQRLLTLLDAPGRMRPF